MRLVVTGVTGFLGGHLAARCLELGHQVMALSRRPEPLFLGHPDYQEVLFSLPCPAGLGERLAGFRPDAILHTAAAASAAFCEAHPEVARQANTEYPAALAAIASVLGCYLCAVSTDLVFDGGKAPPGGFSEQHPACPRSVYAHTKRAGEEAVQESGAAILRSSLVYGPPIGERAGVLAWLLDGWAAGSTVKLFRDEWRTPVLVTEVAQALLGLAEGRMKGLFHCAGPRRLSRVEFGILAARAHGVPERLVEESSREGFQSSPPRPEDVSLNAGKLVQTLGLVFTPPDQGLERTAQIQKKKAVKSSPRDAR